MRNENLFIKMAVMAWESQVKLGDKILSKLNEQQLMSEVVPSKNRGAYILGHLIAVSDSMLPLVFSVESQYPHLLPIYIKTPDKQIENNHSIDDLRAKWDSMNKRLLELIDQMPIEGWLEKHNSISKEDFIKEPHRNKLNVLINRTSHLAYHLGQLALLNK